MSQLTIVAKILAKEDKRDLVKAALIKLIPVTRLEKGCINYDLHQDNTNPNLFYFYENWLNKELWQQHMENAPLAAYMKTTEGAVAEFTLNELTIIG